MIVKLLEIRDQGTCIPAMAIHVSRKDGGIIRRAGFSDEGSILLTMLAKPETQWDAFAWQNSRTMRTAHLWLQDNWLTVANGQVIDVRVILGEATEPAVAECV